MPPACKQDIKMKKNWNDSNRSNKMQFTPSPALLLGASLNCLDSCIRIPTDPIRSHKEKWLADFSAYSPCLWFVQQSLPQMNIGRLHQKLSSGSILATGWAEAAG